MVDFRYHLVSIIAIFMALALGIIVGTTQLNDQVLDNLKGSISNLTKDKRNLETSTRTLQSEVGQSDAFITSVAPDLVAGDLRGESVLLVTAPDAPADLVTDLTPLLQQAGATVVGRLQLKAALLEPARAQTLDDLVTAVRPPALQLPTSGPLERAGTLLAAALLRDRSDTGIPEAAAERVLGGLGGEDFVDLDRTQGGPRRATLAVVLAPAFRAQAPTDVDVARNAGLLALVQALDARSQGVVVAGPLDATREGGLLEALRDDAALGEDISSVDSADRPAGQVLVVKALVDQMNGISRRYGGGQGAQPVVPSPAPS